MPAGPVLVVDDSAPVRSVLTLILSDAGYQVETASNGAEALQVLTQVQPACVLLDMRMPVLDGWGFVRELEARQIDVPVVVMAPEEHAQQWCQEIQAADCLAKPITLDDLLACVERLCGEAGTAAG